MHQGLAHSSLPEAQTTPINLSQPRLAGWPSGSGVFPAHLRVCFRGPEGQLKSQLLSLVRIYLFLQ